jgi:toxin ParE1/3/4
MRVVLSARAEADLANIFADSIARFGETQARRYAQRFDQSLSILTTISAPGRARSELGEGIRSMPVGAHILFFKFVGDEALVLSVRHARRRTPSGEDLE